MAVIIAEEATRATLMISIREAASWRKLSVLDINVHRNWGVIDWRSGCECGRGWRQVSVSGGFNSLGDLDDMLEGRWALITHPSRYVVAKARPEEEQLHLLRHLRVCTKEQLVYFDSKLGNRLKLLLAQVAKLL